jgi:hypothetical protein
MNNSAGFLFGNRQLGVSVQRWTDLDNFGDAVTLVDYMFEEMAFTDGHTVILDLSALQPAAESELYQLALTMFCIKGVLVKRVALVGMSTELSGHVGFAQLVRCAKAHDVTFVQSGDFAGAVALLNATAHTVQGLVLPQEIAPGSENTYAGSVCTWPTNSAVVVALAGNDGDEVALEQTIQKGLQYARESAAKVLVLDSTASAPVSETRRLQFILDKLVAPVLAAQFAHVIHVRPRGDKFLMAEGSPDVSAMLNDAGVTYERTTTLAQATLRLDQLAGHAFSSAEQSSARH